MTPQALSELAQFCKLNGMLDMRVLIDASGEHSPDFHYMRVDDHGLLVDLDHVRNSIVDPGTLTDATVVRVEWGPTTIHGRNVEAGRIVRQDGTVQPFFDRNLLRPYLALFEARKAELLGAK